MKQLAIFIFLILIGQLAFTQNNKQKYESDDIQTILSRDRSNGGYGAFSIGYSEIDNKDAIVMGARGAWIIDHSFALGLGGYGFINDINYDNPFNNDLDYNLAGGYGGIILEPILAPKLPVHLSFPVLFGVGGVAYVEHHNHWDYWWDSSDNSDVFWVVEPAIELEFNLTRYFRMAATASYRMTSNINMQNTDPEILNGFDIGMVFKFGKF